MRRKERERERKKKTAVDAYHPAALRRLPNGAAQQPPTAGAGAGYFMARLFTSGRSAHSPPIHHHIQYITVI